MGLHPLESDRFTRIGDDMGYNAGGDDGGGGGENSNECKNDKSEETTEETRASVILEVA